MDSKKRKIIERFWLKKLDGELAKISLPLLKSKESARAIQPGAASRESLQFEIPGEIVAKFKKMSKGQDIVIFVVFLSGLNIVINKYTGIGDLLIGTMPPKDNAINNEILFCRNHVEGDLSFKEFINHVKRVVLEAFKHASEKYSFNDIYRKMCIRREVDVLDIFNTAFIYEKLQDRDKFPVLPAAFDLLVVLSQQESRMVMEVEYAGNLYSAEIIGQFGRHVIDIFADISSKLDKAISSIDMLSPGERNRILYELNDTHIEYPREKTIHELFTEQVEKGPDGAAVVCGGWHPQPIKKRRAESVGQIGTVQLTYGELNRKSNQLARKLRKEGVEPDTVVGIMVERSLGMLVGVLGILKAGGAYLPIDVEYPGERITYMIEDCDSYLLLTQKKYVNRVKCPVEVIDLENDALYEGDAGNLEPAAGWDNLAYVIYTSGTTGRPKGVMVEQRSVVRLVKNSSYLDFDDEHRILQTGALEFDASTFEIWGALLNGSTLFLVDRDTILTPERLKAAIRQFTISTMWMTSPLFNQLELADIEIFSGLKYLLVGGDVLNPVHINRVREKFPYLHVINGYGPTENTTFSTTFLITKEDRDNIPIGSPISNSTAYIVDRGMHLLPIGISGELVVGGDGVSRGYLNRPDLTAVKFLDLTAKTREETRSLPSTHPLTHSPYSPIYRTGDLARWLFDGNIEFLGRLDHQVKIRGFRIELGEIESRLTAHADVREAVVRVISTTGGEETQTPGERDKRLCAYIVPASGVSPDIPGLREYLSLRLPDYMIPSFFVQLEKIPLTPNGKVDWRSLPGPEMETGDRYTAPREETEETLTEMWAEILGLDKSVIGIDDNFFELGGHSLKATILLSKMQKKFDIRMELTEIFINPFIRALAKCVNEAQREGYVSLEPVEKKEYYDLSYAQRRLWIICQLEENSTTYNIPDVLIIHGVLNVEAYQWAIQTLIHRHESLRTVFVPVGGEPKQRILTHLHFDLEQIDLRHLEEEEKGKKAREIYASSAGKPFDLQRGLLFLFSLVRLEDEKYLSVFNIHHIVNDGWSQGIIIDEIFILYNAFGKNRENPLQPLKYQYKDYSWWHNALIGKNHFLESEKHWLEKFRDKPTGIELPLDHPRGSVQTFNGSRRALVVDEEKITGFRGICLEKDVTFFMGLLSLLGIFLHRYSGQTDIIVGAPIAGRQKEELHDMVGFLVNTLVFRCEINPAEGFRELLGKIKRETMACYEHQDYPFDLLVDKLGLERDLSRSPLFNVMLAHNNTGTFDTKLAMGGLTVEEYPYTSDFNMSKFDLLFYANEFDNQVAFGIEYNSDLFDDSTIERMFRNFMALWESVIKNPDAPVSVLDCMDNDEYERVVKQFNDARCSFTGPSLQQLFENQVERCEDKAAVFYENSRMTYSELNKRVNQLARYLREEFSVKPGDIIGISIDRSMEMIIAILGVIKSGAAYMAVDPAYPDKRISYMLKDSDTNLVIVDQSRPELFSEFNGNVIDIGSDWETIGLKSRENPGVINRSADILYVTYTSGSTGVPNGAGVSHGILTNLICWQEEKSTIDGSLRCLQFASINFDVSFQEIMTALTSGGELYLIDEMERKDMEYLQDFLSTHSIEVLYLPFYYLNFLFSESEPGRWGESFPHRLKHIVTAGEQLVITPGLKSFLESNPGVRLHNHYGPAEMHVVTSYTLDASTVGDWRLPPIGKPISNIGIYILDDHEQPVPVGVWGEIYIGGTSGFVGYINRVGLTAEKLLVDPVICGDNDMVGLYRTGDIGRWLEDGNIEFRNRKDFQVKIRGFRVEPGEIEIKILSIENVRECVVVAREDAFHQKHLVVYVVKGDIEVEELNRILSDDLPQYMVPRVVVLESLPRLPNGKVDRSRLPEVELESVVGAAGEYAVPCTSIQEKLVEIWSEVLGVEQDHIGIDHIFFEIGGHSLKAAIMISLIHKELEVKVPLAQIFKTPSIRELSRFIVEAAGDKYVSIEPVEEKEYYPLSPAQKRMYIIQQLGLQSITYNLPQVLALDGQLDVRKLEETFEALVDRHESFRTSFIRVNDEPVQKVPVSVGFGIEYFSVERRAELADIVESFVRPFVLSQAPLLRVGLVKIEEETFLLMIDMHHIIADGISYAIFVSELMTFYQGEKLPELKFRYRDYSEWQSQKRKKEIEALEKQEDFWVKEFEGEIPVLNLPTDYVRPETFDFEGTRSGFRIGKEETKALQKFMLKEDVTLFMVLLAVYYVLLAKTSGQDDIVVGTPIAGRPHADLQNIIGMFVNTLVLRNYPGSKKTFRNFLGELKERSLKAFENENYQFEDLVDKLGIKRKANRNPLFSVMFGLQNIGDQSRDILEIKIPGLRLRPYKKENRISKVDLMFYAFEKSDLIDFMLEYSTKLFKEETIEILQERYLILLKAVLENPGCKIEDLEHKTKIEKEMDDVGKVEFEF